MRKQYESMLNQVKKGDGLDKDKIIQTMNGNHLSNITTMEDKTYNNDSINVL